MFLSHSSKDFELVRQIRNTLEEHGFRPITFFLKCITDSTELDGLIKREIEARRWFVFVDSENSRNSKWAQEELAYARELNKTVYTVDTVRDYLPQLKQILQRTTVFLSYSHHDKEIATKIQRALIENDFQVWWDDDVSPGVFWPDEIANRIDTAGFCLCLISRDSIQSQSFKEEFIYAFHKKRPVLPVLIGDVQLSSSLQILLTCLQYAQLSASPTPSELTQLINHIIQYQEGNDL